MTRRGPGLAVAAACAALLAVSALGTARAAAGGAAVVGVAQVGPVWLGPGWPVATPWLYPGACLPYGRCFGAPWDERRQRQRAAAPEPPPADADLWGAAGSPWGYVRRLPPPTPESQIQPRYRDASTIRPEYGGP